MLQLQAVSEREIQFLNESNRIEGIHEIDYSSEKFQVPEKGHFGAYLSSQEAAREHRPLTTKMIRTWQALLGKEQQQFSGDFISEEEIGHIRGPALHRNVRIGNHIPPHYERVPQLFQFLIEDINADLGKNQTLYSKDDRAFTQFLGSSFLRFEQLHPFTDGNGRTGRLLANYIATYCNRPILVFPSERISRNRYLEAHSSETAMGEYMAKRVNEAFSSAIQHKMGKDKEEA